MGKTMSGLTAEQIAKRRFSIGGSDANIIMSGDPAAILALWETKLGKREPDDLSHVQPVQFGIYTEPLNRRFYTHKTGHEITDVGRELKCEGFDFLTCTLDGIVPSENAVFEAKCVNAFSNSEETAQKYMSQLHHNMRCAGLKRAVLSIFIGTLKYEHFIVESDPFYAATLLDAETAFWAHVQSKTAPGDLPTITAPVTGPVKLRTVDMKGSNAWAVHASTYRATKDIAKKYDAACKELKALVEPDVGEAFGGNVQIKRAKNGNLTISEMKP
jgi:predicted phage-related endonuclease